MKFNIVNVMPQINTQDCGLHAIANACELVLGHDPAKCLWSVRVMRDHLQHCFESGKMDRFPTTKERRIPFGRRLHDSSFEREVYCVCRMPYFEDGDSMIECTLCHSWFHGGCVGVDVHE